MKGWVLGFVFLGCLINISAQNKNLCGATYFDSIPLYIESNLYADKLYAGNEFMTVPEKVRISLAQRQVFICGNTFLRLVKKCIDKSKLGQIEYRIILKNHLPFVWRALPNSPLLAELSLQSDQKIAIQFRRKGKQNLIQQTIIMRPDWSPLINGYRELNLKDTSDSKLKSDAAYKTRVALLGFKPLIDNNIVLQPGNQVELQFDSRDISIDSCIEYRIWNVKEFKCSSWRYTGHVLSLRNISANNDYLLQVRYGGEQNTKTYRIHALAFWWQKLWAIALFVVAGIFLIVSSPVYFIKRQNRKITVTKDRLKEQLKKGQNKLNPHFVFNAMSSIGGLVISEQNDRANEYLNTFSDIMRRTLKNSDRLFIYLSDEIEHLQKYIALEQLGLEFRLVLHIDPDLDLDSIDFPPMLLQPTIENAVKHGVADLGQKGIIWLSLFKKGDDLLITIKDNGKFISDKPSKSVSVSGHGIALTKERIEILGKLFPKEKISYHLEQEETGTNVCFTFENWLA